MNPFRKFSQWIDEQRLAARRRWLKKNKIAVMRGGPFFDTTTWSDARRPGPQR